jgi:hypothetical protein
MTVGNKLYIGVLFYWGFLGVMNGSAQSTTQSSTPATEQYVDSSLSALQSTYLQLQGGTMSGALNLAGDPTSAMQAATKEYVDAHAASGGAQLPQAQTVIAGAGDGSAVSMAEKGVAVTASGASVAWDEDRSAGIYDPRNPAYAGGINGPTPGAAAQAMSNQMACDLAMGKVTQATAKWPQGTYVVDELVLAPGSTWEGAKTSPSGTTLHSEYNNHFLVHAPYTMTVTCSDGNSYTDSANNTRFEHFQLKGCTQGGCTNAPGDTGNYQYGGPFNTGIEMSSTNGILEYVYADAFGGYGIHVDGQDTKSFHIGGGSIGADNIWYYYGGYKGYGESLASPETSVTTTGSTSSVALSWAAVAGANAYAVYRGTASGSENVFYIVTTNSFTDTGAATYLGPNYSVVSNATGAPGTVTPTASTTGGTLAAGTYYYEVTALTNDGWHGSFELIGTDNMADYVEAYGLFDLPTPLTYHHIADIVFLGGNNFLDHAWPQVGQVGIAMPYGGGGGEWIDRARVDFTRLEGIWGVDTQMSVTNSIIGASCGASNAKSFNNGLCDQLSMLQQGVRVDNVQFNQYPAFGSTYGTADLVVGGPGSSVTHTNGAAEFGPDGLVNGDKWEPTTTDPQSVTLSNNTYVATGLRYLSPADTTPVIVYALSQTMIGQDIYILGGNSNVTLLNNASGGRFNTCSGQNINLGQVQGTLHFLITKATSGYTNWAQATEICNSNSVAGSETVAFSATPVFSTRTRASIITLSGNVTSFTLGAGADGQEKMLTFCQNGTGGYTVAAPVNVRGFFTVGTTASECNSQHFTYSAGQSAWLADSPGVTNQ